MDKLGKLVEIKNDLFKQKDNIINKKATKFQKFLYFLGMGVTGVSSFVTFWNTTPSLIFCITYLYIVGVPYFYVRDKEFRIGLIENKLKEIQNEINCLDECINFEKKDIFSLNKRICNINKVNQDTLTDCYEDYYCDCQTINDGPKLRFRK